MERHQRIRLFQTTSTTQTLLEATIGHRSQTGMDNQTSTSGSTGLESGGEEMREATVPGINIIQCLPGSNPTVSVNFNNINFYGNRGNSFRASANEAHQRASSLSSAIHVGAGQQESEDKSWVVLSIAVAGYKSIEVPVLVSKLWKSTLVEEYGVVYTLEFMETNSIVQKIRSGLIWSTKHVIQTVEDMEQDVLKLSYGDLVFLPICGENGYKLVLNLESESKDLLTKHLKIGKVLATGTLDKLVKMLADGNSKTILAWFKEI